MNRSKDLPPETLETLARWEADEARVRGLLAEPGVARREQLAGMTGMDMFEAIGSGCLPSVPIGAAMDFWPVAYERGQFVFQGRPSARFLNPLGTIHGGWIATLLDSAVACAVHTLLPADTSYTTAELKVSYVRALTLDVPLVRAEGKVINSGRTLGFAEGRLVGPDGRLYAHATTTCVVLGGGRANGT
ncbi:PaaI family thioesterase [Aquabacterium sp. OR-4]|uniref:PaaI family thioesterase n=1 Tax=Aquabacterium sp. OR-4 TaxID=2978127 RepID=UPI0021B25F9B|nr:PaaI family thioesterase [Aquabacterium sp. OR-4]MDT7838510.1 PaaI family thioesterase [Aquabacterium sp. OR-4]